MNSRSTIWLVALALGLFAYIALVERPGRDTAEPSAAEPLLPEFDPTAVTSIEIFRSNSVIRVERTNGLWRLAQLNYPAQSSVVNKWLAAVAASHRRAHVTAKELLAEPGGPAAFGVENPTATVTLQQGGRNYQFRVGRKTTVGDMLYLQSVGDDGVFVTESDLADTLPVSATAWRDPAFAPMSGLKFNRAVVRSSPREIGASPREFEVQRDPTNQLWRLTKPRSARADNALLGQVYQQLQAARVIQFVSDLPGNDLEPYGLQPPELTLTLADGTNTVLALEFGRSPTNDAGAVYARRSTHPSIVTVPKELTDRLRTSYTDFLDRRLIEIGPEAVSRIEVRAAETFALEKQTNGGWRVVEPVSFPADPGLMTLFFQRLNSLQITDVTKEVVTDADLPTYGLAPPKWQYVLKRPDATTNSHLPVAEIDFGNVQGNRIFARRIDENSVYSVRLEDALELPKHAVELHDRRIWQFTTNQVVSMSFTVGTNQWKLLRSGDGLWKLGPGSQGIINPFAMEEAMYHLGQLFARAWVVPEEGKPAAFGFGETGARLSIQLDTGDAPRTLSVEFGKLSPTGGPYARTELETGPAVFEFPFEIFRRFQEAVRHLTAGAKP